MNFFLDRLSLSGRLVIHYIYLKSQKYPGLNGRVFKKNGLKSLSENESHHLFSALKSISLLLKESDVEGIIIGGLAVSLLGRPRYTNDIDLVVLNLDNRLSEFITRLKKLGIEPRIEDVEEFAAKSRVLLMRHIDSGINVDISMGVLPFEINAVAHRKIESFSGLEIFLPSPEDLIIFKSVAQRPQDIEDIKSILTRYPELDKEYILSCVKEFSDILERMDLFKNIEKLINA